jgi:tetrahydromethanopterin S-methyltransferase subunit G
METMARETWTDERLDDFGKHVDHRFDEVDRRFGEVNQRLDKVDARLESMDDRMAAMQRTMVQGAVGMCGAMFAGFAVVCTVIALVI